MNQKASVDLKQYAALIEFEDYCEKHPGSPSAVRRPRLLLRGPSYVALLGDNLQNGVVGIGGTVTAALRAFDACYLNSLRPQE
jgi:hypothetical protein